MSAAGMDLADFVRSLAPDACPAAARAGAGKPAGQLGCRAACEVATALAADPCQTDGDELKKHPLCQEPVAQEGNAAAIHGLAAAPAPAPWECAACGEPNRPSRLRCNNCGANAPWIIEREPVEDVDARSTSEASPSPVRSLEDSPASPPRSVAESPARSVAASGSARSVAESERRPARSVAGSPGGLVDLASGSEKEGEDDVEWEAQRLRGEIADARARIFHDC